MPGQVLPANPASSVRWPTHVVRTGKTPVLQPAEARWLLASINGADLAGQVLVFNETHTGQPRPSLALAAAAQ